MKHLSIIIFLFALVDGLCACFHGQVVKVVNGDTFEVKTTTLRNTYTSNGKVRIRLYGIDCPELDQPFGKEAKTFVSNYIYMKRVLCKECFKFDNNLLGYLYPSNHKKGKLLLKKDLIEFLLRNGLAWVYDKYYRYKKEYDSIKPSSHHKKIDKENVYWKKLQAEAKKKKKGLWSQPNPIPPWEWRKRKKK
jgi:endonuclease YncB( thermonuclease family)